MIAVYFSINRDHFCMMKRSNKPSPYADSRSLYTFVSSSAIVSMTIYFFLIIIMKTTGAKSFQSWMAVHDLDTYIALFQEHPGCPWFIELGPPTSSTILIPIIIMTKQLSVFLVCIPFSQCSFRETRLSWSGIDDRCSNL